MSASNPQCPNTTPGSVSATATGAHSCTSVLCTPQSQTHQHQPPCHITHSLQSALSASHMIKQGLNTSHTKQQLRVRCWLRVLADKQDSFCSVRKYHSNTRDLH
eukprot:scpid38576/ scgid18678/ 